MPISVCYSCGQPINFPNCIPVSCFWCGSPDVGPMRTKTPFLLSPQPTKVRAAEGTGARVRVCSHQKRENPRDFLWLNSLAFLAMRQILEEEGARVTALVVGEDLLKKFLTEDPHHEVLKSWYDPNHPHCGMIIGIRVFQVPEPACFTMMSAEKVLTLLDFYRLLDARTPPPDISVEGSLLSPPSTSAS
jgi:hypothetical protein